MTLSQGIGGNNAEVIHGVVLKTGGDPLGGVGEDCRPHDLISGHLASVVHDGETSVIDGLGPGNSNFITSVVSIGGDSGGHRYSYENVSDKHNN